MAIKQSTEQSSEQWRADSGEDRGRNTNPDAITGAPGSHPVGTGVGAAGGGVAGAAVGAAIGSVVPGIGTAIGGVVGAVVGATGGGLVGKDIAESVNPTLEEEYWRENWKSRPYAIDVTSYDEVGPAYRYGWESRTRYMDRDFEDVEGDLARDWDSARSSSTLGWDKAKAAARDAWDRVDRPANKDETVSTLNTLIETLNDGTKGFETAAEHVTDENVKSLFKTLSNQRARFAGELTAVVRGFGGETGNGGSASGAMHRGWIDLKSSLGGHEKSILNEAERGEDVAVKSYEKALATNLAPEAAELVREQFLEVKMAHDRVRALRDSWR